MDLEVSVLTATVATTLVRQMTTDGWERVHSALGAWWRRARPGSEGGTVDAHLARSRATALDARKSGDAGAEQLLVDEWQVRLGAVLADRPQVADELRRLLAEWQRTAPGPGTGSGAAAVVGAAAAIGVDQAVQAVQAVQAATETTRIDLTMQTQTQASPGHGRMTFTGREVHLVDPD